MCGIAGCFGIQDRDTIARMPDAVGHRGPDDRGIHVQDSGVFGFDFEEEKQAVRGTLGVAA